MGLPPWAASSSQRFVLVTGANSGLGYSICERLVDEFLSQPWRDPASHLVLIFTTRSAAKARATGARLRRHVRAFTERSAFAQGLRRGAEAAGKRYRWKDQAARVHLLTVEIDLCDLGQVYAAARKINGRDGGIGSPEVGDGAAIDAEGKMGLRNIAIPRLDVIIMNAGIGGWSGLNIPLAIWSLLIGMPDAATWPLYKIAIVGSTVTQQVQRKLKIMRDGSDEATQKLLHGSGYPEGQGSQGDAVIGEVFCANLFGHYILGHELMSLLNNTEGRVEGERGRIVWISSIEAQDQVLLDDDLQCTQTDTPYEYTKRLTDVLALTAHLPSVQKANASYFEYAPAAEPKKKKKGEPVKNTEMYLTHPGVCASNIMELPLVLQWCMVFIFWLSRAAFNSVWHPVTTYKGAVAPVWIALAEQRTLDSLEGPAGDAARGQPQAKAKWGSSTNRWGHERVRKTEVGGWGWSGVVDERDRELTRRGRKRGAVDLTVEKREEFEMLGARCWRGMEALRREWEGRLGSGEAAVNGDVDRDTDARQ